MCAKRRFISDIKIRRTENYENRSAVFYRALRLRAGARLDVKEISIEAGAILRLPDLFRDGLLEPYGCPLVICDRNTYEAAGRKVLELIKADCICLPPEGAACG